MFEILMIYGITHNNNKEVVLRRYKHLKRLDQLYINEPIYFITTCTYARHPILNNDSASIILVDEWTAAVFRHGWVVGRYIIMPDLVHFFCRPGPNAKALSKFMMRWKEWSSKNLKMVLGYRETVWQQGFFDHVLRSHENYSAKWNYVFQNPMRAGLVEKPEHWPWSGEVHPLSF